MSVKEFLKEALYTYFIIVTLVVVSTFVLGMIYEPDRQFGYEAFLSPLLYGFLGVVPMLVMYSRKELSVKQILVRKVFQLIALEVLLFSVTFGLDGIEKAQGPMALGLGLSVFIIFLLVHIISFILDCGEAKKMNEALKELE